MVSGGKSRRQRRGGGVKASSGSDSAPPTSGKASAILTAAYIAEMSRDLRLMARAADLEFLSHLLALAQAEAEYAAEWGD